MLLRFITTQHFVVLTLMELLSGCYDVTEVKTTEVGRTQCHAAYVKCHENPVLDLHIILMGCIPLYIDVNSHQKCSNLFFLFQLNAHNMLNVYIYHQLPSTSGHKHSGYSEHIYCQHT